MLDSLRDVQCETPACYCDQCWAEVFPHETMVLFGTQWLCPDCFQAAIEQMLRENMPLLAQEMQLSTKNA